MRVLLVEDNDDHAELVEFALEGQVADVRRAVDGEDALQALAEKGARFDLLLLDINMPRVDGIEVLRRAKKTTVGKRTPMVMLTTSASPRDRLLAYENHANGYVVKPVEFDELQAMLSAVVAYWGRWNQTPDLPQS